MSRTPLRITFTGGGTDLQQYYSRGKNGAVISAAINKYIYVAVNKKFDDLIRVSYSVTEIVDHIDRIKHPSVREALRLLNIDGGIEIVSISDIPSRGTGLGSSSTFLVGLLNALHAYRGEHMSARELSEEAVKIERNILREPGGKQDQYIAATGGIQMLEFMPDESVQVNHVIMNESARSALESWILMFYTGKERSSTEIHRKQSAGIEEKISGYDRMRELTYEALKAISDADMIRLGECLHENWNIKKSLSDGISDPWIDSLYSRAMEMGAVGGKIIGAGGGGFLMLLAPPETHPEIISDFRELRQEPFRFDYTGSKIVFIGD